MDERKRGNGKGRWNMGFRIYLTGIRIVGWLIVAAALVAWLAVGI